MNERLTEFAGKVLTKKNLIKLSELAFVLSSVSCTPEMPTDVEKVPQNWADFQYRTSVVSTKREGIWYFYSNDETIIGDEKNPGTAKMTNVYCPQGSPNPQFKVKLYGNVSTPKKFYENNDCPPFNKESNLSNLYSVVVKSQKTNQIIAQSRT